MGEKVLVQGVFVAQKIRKKWTGTGFVLDLKFRFKLTATTENHNIITKPFTFGSCVIIMEKGCVKIVGDGMN